MGGELFLAEIREQPNALLRLLDQERAFADVAEALRRFEPATLRLVGHGTSDNAASYGVYAFGLLPGWTALRDSISLTVYYGAAIDFSRSAVVALSQSGQTPDVVEYVARARAGGALTIAVTNEPAAELGRTAELVLPLAAGPERAVAATKTYVNQLAALALLASGTVGRGPAAAEALRRVATLLDESIPRLEQATGPVAAALAFVGRMFVIGRGLEFATAREIALKLTETCRVAAEPLTATDLVHGPVAALDPFFPVWAIASPDESLPAVVAAAARVRSAGAAVVASGSAAAEIVDPVFSLPVPDAGERLFAPLLSVVPGQLFAAALAHVKGLDADVPTGLTKVTLAQ